MLAHSVQSLCGRDRVGPPCMARQRHAQTPCSLVAVALKRYMINKPQDLESLVIQVNQAHTRSLVHEHAHSKLYDITPLPTTTTATADATRHALPDADGAVGGMHGCQNPRRRKHQGGNYRGIYSPCLLICMHVCVHGHTQSWVWIVQFCLLAQQTNVAPHACVQLKKVTKHINNYISDQEQTTAAVNSRPVCGPCPSTAVLECCGVG